MIGRGELVRTRRVTPVVTERQREQGVAIAAAAFGAGLAQVVRFLRWNLTGAARFCRDYPRTSSVLALEIVALSTSGWARLGFAVAGCGLAWLLGVLWLLSSGPEAVVRLLGKIAPGTRLQRERPEVPAPPPPQSGIPAQSPPCVHGFVECALCAPGAGPDMRLVGRDPISGQRVWVETPATGRYE